jgi:hypothetical protein
MRKKIKYRRSDPFAINPEKILAREKKKASGAQKLCEACYQRVATVHTTTCDSSGATGWSDFCESCYESRYKSRKHGNCMYCGAPAQAMGGYALSTEKEENVHILFRCEVCQKVAAEFRSRPEYEELWAEVKKSAKLRMPANMRDDDLFKKLQKMTQEMEKHVRECAARRKQA